VRGEIYIYHGGHEAARKVFPMNRKQSENLLFSVFLCVNVLFSRVNLFPD
jgi:hypothetical protein